MKIQIKLLLGTSLILLMILFFGIYTWKNYLHTSKRVNFMRQGSMQEVVYLSQLSNNLHESYAALQEMLEESLRDKLLEAEAEAENDTKEEIHKASSNIDRNIENIYSILKQLKNATEHSLFLAQEMEDDELEEEEGAELSEWNQKIFRTLKEYEMFLGETKLLIKGGNLTGATELLENKLEPLFRDELFPLVDIYLQDSIEELDEESEGIIENSERISTILGWSAISILISTVAITILLGPYDHPSSGSIKHCS